MSRRVYVRTPEGDVYDTADPEHWIRGGAVQVPAREGRAAMRDQSIKRIRALVRPGDTVHTVLRHVSASGMSRRIDLYVLKGGEALEITGHAARATGLRHHDAGGLILGGCGMDMGFQAVYLLSSAVWPRYRCKGRGKCPSPDHVNWRLDLTCPGLERDGVHLTCYRPAVWRGDDIPADWPRVRLADEIDVPAACLVSPDGSATREVCPTCEGRGRIPNPDPEPSGYHRDGYALRQRWL